MSEPDKNSPLPLRFALAASGTFLFCIATILYLKNKQDPPEHGELPLACLFIAFVGCGEIAMAIPRTRKGFTRAGVGVLCACLAAAGMALLLCIPEMIAGFKRAMRALF